MQYGIRKENIKKYQVKNAINIKFKPTQFIIMFLAGLFLSRAYILIGANDIKGIAPFGVVFLIAIVLGKNEINGVIVACGSLIGYISIANMTKDGLAYIIAILLIIGYSVICERLNYKVKGVILFLLYLVSQLIHGQVISRYDLVGNVFFSLANTLVLIPIFYVIRYGIKCIEEVNTNYFFTIEEIISISILICLMVSGIGSVAVGDFSIRDIVAISVVVVASYLGGASYGGAIGISMGVILGISTGDILSAIGYYGVIGLVSGLFKETGKIFSIISAMVMYSILGLYSNSINLNGFMEVFIGATALIILPKNIIKLVEKEIDIDSKNDSFNETQITQIKDEFSERIQNLSEALNVMAMALSNVGSNSKLSYKDKSTEMIDNLVERICNNCDSVNKCWRSDFNQTYSAFEQIIQGKEQGKNVFPNVLEKRCYSKYKILNETDSIILAYNANELNRKKLEEGRQLIGENIKNMSLNIESMVDDFKKEVTACGDLERILRRELNKSSIGYKNIFCYTDKYGKLKIKIALDKCIGGKHCSKNILPIVNSILNKPMMLGIDGCRINPNNKECVAVISELPRYRVESYANTQIKKGEECSGDSYTFRKISSGNYLTLLSDGMGSGPEAAKDSRITIDLVEKFIDSGFGIETTLNIVNSIMAMKFDEDEKFSTLDLNLLNLYKGEANFVKVGATFSYIKRGNEVIKISSSMPPFGLVDNIEIKSVKENIRNGDIIITVSDGVLDVKKDRVGDGKWLEDFLRKVKGKPADLVVEILEESKRINNGNIDDDMTILVSKVFSIY